MSQIITLLEDGWSGKLPGLGYLQTVAGLDDEAAASVCGVATCTYQRWRTDRPAPLYAFRLLTIMAGYVPWAGWERWIYNRYDHTLNAPDLKDGFNPSQLGEFLFLRQTYKAHAATVSPKKEQIFPTCSINRQAQGHAPLRGARSTPLRRRNIASSATEERPLFGLSGRHGQRLRKDLRVNQERNRYHGIYYAQLILPVVSMDA
ncbi:MAG: hypothetical protein HY356_09335 [Gammaproteobacteria bacterium]|nr:hypothetical protein [Gammaproteobacteria bacterium]